LTLGHLESAFYSEALAQFDTSAFLEAGYSLRDRERFVERARCEREVVAVLEGTLGMSAVRPCVYDL
jgi:hypothetical protein